MALVDLGQLALTDAHIACILICMRTTLNLKDDLFKRASELTGITEKTALIHAGLEELIQRKSRERLIALGGTMKDLKPIKRRKSA